MAVSVSVAFGFLAAVLELLFPDQILPALFQLVGSTCLVVWGSALVSQLILRRRADRDGTALPLRMKGFPGLTIFGLVLLALIFAVGFSSPESSKQLFSTLVLVAGIAAACWIGARITRNRNAAGRRESRPGGTAQPLRQIAKLTGARGGISVQSGHPSLG